MMKAPRKSWLLRIAPDKNRIYQIDDQSIDGQKSYFFIIIDPAREQEFLAAVENSGPCNIAEFGRVVASGYGIPSQALLEKMHHEFGANV